MSLASQYFRRASMALTLALFIAPQASADTYICHQDGSNDLATVQQDQAAHLATQNVWRAEYYDLKDEKARPAEADKKRLRDKIIASKIAVANAHFQKFATDICALVTGSAPLSTTQKRRYDGLEAQLIFNRLHALIYLKTSAIAGKSGDQSTARYSLHNAEQDLQELEWPLIMFRAINDVQKMKLDALQAAASGVPGVK